jgi:serine/threonine protein kinase
MDLVGQNLGQYRIVEPVGAGGMATVYKAFQPGLDRYVAVKVLPAQHALTPGFKERFFREAKAVAQLSHPNILPIYDVGIENDISYFVMKYVPGRTLKDVMGHSLPAEAVCDYMDQLAGALDHAHTRGILHRDIKPVNVLLEDDWLLLADFGLAKIVEGTEALTATGSSMGTPAYVSPEQAVGKPVDHHTDIYSLGVVLYEMATGQVPYSGETPMGVMFKHVYEPLPMPRQVNPDLSEAVERVILKALAKNPDDRFDRAGELATALREAVETGTTETVISTAPMVAAPGAQPPRGDSDQTVAQQPEATSTNTASSGSTVTGVTRRPLWLWLGLAAVTVVLVGGAAVLISGLSNGQSTSRRSDLIIAEADTGNGSIEAGAAEPAAEADTAAAPEATEAIAAAPPPPAEAAAEAAEVPAPTEEPTQAVAAEAPVSDPSPEPVPTTPSTAGSSSVASGPRPFDDVPTLAPSIRLGRGPINELAVNPNGQSLAVASSTGVWLYDLPDLNFIRQLEGSGSRISSVAWSPDGKQVAAGTAAGPVHIWDAASGTEAQRLEGHTTDAISVAWSPDGTRLAAGSEAATIRIWDAGDGQELVELFGHLYEPYSLAWAPERQRG